MRIVRAPNQKVAQTKMTNKVLILCKTNKKTSLNRPHGARYEKRFLTDLIMILTTNEVKLRSFDFDLICFGFIFSDPQKEVTSLSQNYNFAQKNIIFIKFV